METATDFQLSFGDLLDTEDTEDHRVNLLPLQPQQIILRRPDKTRHICKQTNHAGSC